ncbi:MAG: AI-2E family transporter [Clostridiales bacterium]|nr:AI-2E family transporter [Clostridiales bacterium]
MKAEKKHYLKLMLTLFASAALAILFYFLLSHLDAVGGAFSTLIGILMPFIVGGVIAYILTPICNFLERKLSSGLSILLTLLLAVLVIIALLLLVIPALVESIQSILLQIPDSMESFQSWAVEQAGDNETLQNYINDLTEAVSINLPEWISSTVLPNLQTMIGSISAGVSGFVSIIYNLLIGVIVSIYVLGNRRTFARQGKKLIYSVFRKKWADAVLEEFRFANRMFSGFISGRLLDSLIVGLICFVGMLIFRIPNAVLISVIIGITNILPFFGPWIGAIPSFLLVLMEDPVKSIIFLVFILILQQFDGNVLGPRIIGDKTGLSSFWVLFAILLFGGLFGFIGMIIGVPVFAVIYDIVCKLVNHGLAYRQRQDSCLDTVEGNHSATD